MLKYKISVLSELKKAGFTQFSMRSQNILSEYTMTSIRHQRPISWDTLNTLCALLHCQPGDILEYVPDDPTTNTGK